MNEEQSLKIISQRDLTADENLWLDMRSEAIKQTPAKMSDTLVRLITLTTAMAGGAIGVLKDDVSTVWGRIFATSFFFLALISAVIGSLPRTTILPEYPFDDLKTSIRRTMSIKKYFVWTSISFLIMGVLSAILGVVFHAYGQIFVNFFTTNPN